MTRFLVHFQGMIRVFLMGKMTYLVGLEHGNFGSWVMQCDVTVFFPILHKESYNDFKNAH